MFYILKLTLELNRALPLPYKSIIWAANKPFIVIIIIFFKSYYLRRSSVAELLTLTGLKPVCG